MRFYQFALLCFSLLGLLPKSQYQKLFYKEGFENCLPCDEDLNLSFCKGWEQTILSRVFIMADCNSAMPSNGFGFQYPFEGKAYAGLNVIQDARQVFNKQGGNKATFRSRGYMRLILAQPLVKNHKYKFSLYVTLGERSAFGVSNLYIDVSERRLKQDKADTACLVADNSFMLTGGRAMYDTINWNNINTEFTAKGGERFITIGLFKGGLSYSGYMALLKNPSNSKGNGCNYFIDNIELREL